MKRPASIEVPDTGPQRGRPWTTSASIWAAETAKCVRNSAGAITEEARRPTTKLSRWLANRAPARVVLETCTEAFSLRLDDDLDQLVMNARAAIKVLEMNLVYGHDSRPELEIKNEIATRERFIQRLQCLSWNELPLERRNRYARSAFTCRFRDEFIRIQLLDGDRAKIRNGFSPFVSFRRCEYSSDGKFSGQDVDWQMTLEAAGEGELPIRLPGLRLASGTVQTTRTFTPSEYERVWKDYRLDDYSRAWAALKALRICLHCLTPLPAGTDDKRRYCQGARRNAARQRRFRVNRPERVMEIQERYWASQPGKPGTRDGARPGAGRGVRQPDQKSAQKH